MIADVVDRGVTVTNGDQRSLRVPPAQLGTPPVRRLNLVNCSAPERRVVRDADDTTFRSLAHGPLAAVKAET